MSAPPDTPFSQIRRVAVQALPLFLIGLAIALVLALLPVFQAASFSQSEPVSTEQSTQAAPDRSTSPDEAAQVSLDQRSPQPESLSTVSAPTRPTHAEDAIPIHRFQSNSAPAEAPFLKQHPEVAKLLAARAFLQGAIAYAEGTYPNAAGANPYQIVLGEQAVESDYKEHPRQVITLNSGTASEVSSDAAGLCQFTSNVWDDLHKKYPQVWYADLPAFHPKNQDLGCLILLMEVGSYQDLMAGVSVNQQGKVAVDVDRFTTAIEKSCAIWASLPCADGIGAYQTPEFGNQVAKPIEDIWRSYQAALEADQRLMDSVFNFLAQAGSVPEDSSWVSENVLLENKVAEVSADR